MVATTYAAHGTGAPLENPDPGPLGHRATGTLRVRNGGGRSSRCREVPARAVPGPVPAVTYSILSTRMRAAVYTVADCAPHVSHRFLFRSHPMPMRDVIAVILGGGAGTRLFPLTRHRSKPAVPVAGKYRIIDVPISNSLNSGVERIFVLTQYNSASLNQHIARAYRFDRFRNGFVTVLAAEQTPDSAEWYQGTADAVRQVLHHVRNFPHTHVLVLSGDQLYRMDYRHLLEYHEQRRADVTLATIPVTAEESSAFGILKTDFSGRITSFHEKPKEDALEGLDSPVSEEYRSAGRLYLASMGIYLFNRHLLTQLLEADPAATDFGKEVIPGAIGKRRIFSFPFGGYWSDIGTIRSFYEANIELAQPRPAFDLYDPDFPIYTNARMLPPAKVEDCTVRNALIAEGSVVVGSRLEDVVVGTRSFIERGCTIRRSVLLGADYIPWHAGREYQPEAPDYPGIGEYSTIENAIIDKNVRIGARSTITNRDGVSEAEGPYYCIRDGVVVIPKNTIVPEDTVL
jgi:glucose-1-phosphate adenylyltransferase